MKVRREILIIFSMILLLVLPATSLGKEIKWVLERPVIPVLVKKPASPVLKVTLIRADNQPYAIQQIDLDLLGSTDMTVTRQNWLQQKALQQKSSLHTLRASAK